MQQTVIESVDVNERAYLQDFNSYKRNNYKSK